MHPSPQFAPSVLLANEPLAYRQALARALETQRPDIQIVTVAPDDLDAAIRQHAPFLVICDRLTELAGKCVSAWIELYPAGARRVTSSCGGNEETAGDLDLTALLAFIERAESPVTG